MRLVTHHVTSSGGRRVNEDALKEVINQESALLALADGLGGHEGGALAANTCVDAVAATFARTPGLSDVALQGLVDRGHTVTILHRGTHERDETPAVVEHLHADPFDEDATRAILATVNVRAGPRLLKGERGCRASRAAFRPPWRSGHCWRRRMP